jgi:predicted dehydrogenase/glycerophosphoryl diester phosphodiesterase
MKTVKIGIVGTGRIAQRFVGECKTVAGVELAAVYHPRISSARFFAEQNRLCWQEVAKGGNGLLLTDDMDIFLENVDGVYIAAPHETHESYVRQFLQAGKHVLCEKPFALSGAAAQEAYVLAAEQHLVCMEAIKSAYCPGMQGVFSLVEQGAIGMVYDVEATFTKIGSAAGREIWSPCGGSFTELGSYTLFPVVRIFGTENTDTYRWSLDSAVGTDSYTKMAFSYPLGTATVKTGLGVKSEGELIIAGEKGYIRVPSPWWLTKRVEMHHEDPGRIECYDFPFEGSGLRYEIAAFRDNIGQMEENGSYSNASGGITSRESIWMAAQMEGFLASRQERRTGGTENTEPSSLNVQGSGSELEPQDVKEQGKTSQVPMKIWAHRGCCMAYPENTLLSFKKAAVLPGLTGIELDVQLTRDRQLVVIHDELLDRTTTGKGHVKDYTLEELKGFAITPSGRDQAYVDEDGKTLTIPTLDEVFALLAPYCRRDHLMINIELKNSVIRYEGMEQMVLALVAQWGLEDNIIYSSFLHASMGLIRQLKPDAQTGTLSGDLLVCLEGMQKYQANALHPANTGMAINPDTVELPQECRIPVRIWNSEEPFFGQSRELKATDLLKYARLGATDIFTNVPEIYLGKLKTNE